MRHEALSNLKLKPYEYQDRGINFHSAKKYSLNGDEMGLGKSLQALATAIRSGVEKVLIVCPAFLVLNWRDEIEKFTHSPEIFRVISYNSLKAVVKEFGSYDMVILDECHYCKNLEAQRTKLIHKLIKEHRPKYFLPLSGTPIKNSVPEFFSILRLIWYGGNYPEFDPYANSIHKFSASFANRRVTDWGVKYEGIKNIGALKALLKPVYIRRKAADVLDLPEEVDREVLFNDKDKTDNFLTTAWESYEGKKQSRSFASGKAISALAKVEYTAEFIKENLEEMGTVLIYTDHVQAAKRLFSELPGSKYVTGDTTVKHRSEYVSQINSGELRILISTIGSLSVGVNITGVNHMVFNDLSWVPADISQARKRIHRIGQTKTCFYYYMLASQVDKQIVRALEKKRKILEAIET